MATVRQTTVAEFEHSGSARLAFFRDLQIGFRRFGGKLFPSNSQAGRYVCFSGATTLRVMKHKRAGTLEPTYAFLRATSDRTQG